MESSPSSSILFVNIVCFSQPFLDSFIVSLNGCLVRTDAHFRVKSRDPFSNATTSTLFWVPFYKKKKKHLLLFHLYKITRSAQPRDSLFVFRNCEITGNENSHEQYEFSAINVINAVTHRIPLTELAINASEL